MHLHGVTHSTAGMSLPPRASPRLLGAQLVSNNFAPPTPPHCAAITHPLISPTSPPSAAPNSPRPTAIDHIMNEARNGGQGTHGLTLSMTAWYLSRLRGYTQDDKRPVYRSFDAHINHHCYASYVSDTVCLAAPHERAFIHHWDGRETQHREHRTRP